MKTVKMLSAEEAAARLGVGPNTVRRACQAGLLPHERTGEGQAGSHYYVKESDLALVEVRDWGKRGKGLVPKGWHKDRRGKGKPKRVNGADASEAAREHEVISFRQAGVILGVTHHAVRTAIKRGYIRQAMHPWRTTGHVFKADLSRVRTVPLTSGKKTLELVAEEPAPLPPVPPTPEMPQAIGILDAERTATERLAAIRAALGGSYAEDRIREIVRDELRKVFGNLD